MAGEYAPSERPAQNDCTDRAAYGDASTLDQYITKQYLLAEEDYPADACPNRYYSTAKIDNWEVTTAQTGAGSITMDGRLNLMVDHTLFLIKRTSPLICHTPIKKGI